MVFSCPRGFNHFSVAQSPPLFCCFPWSSMLRVALVIPAGLMTDKSPEQRLCDIVGASIDYAFTRTSAKIRSQTRAQSRPAYCLGSAINGEEELPKRIFSEVYVSLFFGIQNTTNLTSKLAANIHTLIITSTSHVMSQQRSTSRFPS